MTVKTSRNSRLFHYRMCGTVLSSDFALPDLPPSGNGTEEVAIHIRLAGDARFPTPEPDAWFLSMKTPTERPWLSCAKINDMQRGDGRTGFLLRFHDHADFLIDAEGQEVICRVEPGVPSETLHHLILDQVFPLLFNLRGREVLHATAVLTPWGACAFTGETGMGKSTLATSFLSAGYPVLSDDCLVMQEAKGQILAMPAYPGVRLWDDSVHALQKNFDQSSPVAHYTSKRRWHYDDRAAGFPTEPQPLACVYCLHRDDQEAVAGLEAAISPLSPRDGFLELLGGTFRLDITDRTMLVREFRFLEQVVSRIPIRRLRIPNSYAALPAAREAILADLQAR